MPELTIYLAPVGTKIQNTPKNGFSLLKKLEINMTKSMQRRSKKKSDPIYVDPMYFLYVAFAALAFLAQPSMAQSKNISQEKKRYGSIRNRRIVR